jgi:hypothetical protein
MKMKFIESLCHQFYGFFNLVGMDWRPTQGMIDSVKDRNVNVGFGLDDFPSYEEFVSSPNYEIYWFKKLYE